MEQLFSDAAKKAVKEAVARVEQQTSAEIVVTVHRVAGDYKHTHYLGGLAAALAFLALFLYHPEPFDYTYLPLEQLVAFVIGALITSALPPVKRLLTTQRERDQAVRAAAREAFVDLGVSRTKQRNGVLVFVSAFERRVEVLCDLGIDIDAIGAPLKDAIKKIDRAVRLDRDWERFVEALADLGPALAPRFPRAPDDQDEIDDEPVTKAEDTSDDGDPDDDDDDDAPDSEPPPPKGARR